MSQYALQYGYLVQPAYTFGECDLYTSMTAGAGARMWMLKNLGFVIPVFWGPHWWCPVLPRSDIPLHSVVGSPVQLPRIEEPTDAEVSHWHAVYVAALTEIFDSYKARFGYADRILEVV